MANDPIQIKRGSSADLPTLSQGEFALTTDNDELYLGNGVSNLQIYPSSGGGGGLTWQVVSSDTTASAGNGYLIDGSSGNVTITLPGSPSEGDPVGVCDFYNAATTNVITIARNGNNIEGDASDLTIDIDGSGMTLVYSDATRGWEIVSEIGGAGDTTPAYIQFDTGEMFAPRDEPLTTYDNGVQYDGYHYEGNEPDLILSYYHATGQLNTPDVRMPCMGSLYDNDNPGYIGIDTTNNVIKHRSNIVKILTEDGSGSNNAYNSGRLRLVGVDKPPDFNTGWQSVTTDATKTHSHGLGTEPTITLLEVSDTADGSGVVVPCCMTGNYYSSWRQSAIVEIDNSDIVARFHDNLFYVERLDGTNYAPNSGYYRIKAWTWTPDFDSGWTPISTGENVAFQHGLDQTPRLVWLYFSMTNDWTGDVLNAMSCTAYQYNRGVQIQWIGEKTISVKALSRSPTHYIDASGSSQQPSGTGYIKLHAWY